MCNFFSCKVKTYTYYYMCVETEEVETKTVECKSRLEFLEKLNFWNRAFGAPFFIFWADADHRGLT